MPMKRSMMPAILLAACGLAQANDSTTLTIYSTAAPGAIPAALYRPVPQSLQHYVSYNPYVYGYGYNGRQGLPGYAVVKQERSVRLDKGLNTLAFDDVAALIEPTTVMFESLTDPGTKVVEQSFQFDLVSAQKMLERFVGKEINLDGQTVTLLSANAAGGVLVKEADGQVQWKSGYGSMRFPSLADNLIVKPTLAWDLYAGVGGEHRTRVSYQTEGMTWWADYNIVFTEGKDANSGSLDIGAWVSILNQSGASYADARLKLVAGDVHRAPQPGHEYLGVRAEVMDQAGQSAPAGFAEKSFFEYHLYTLGRQTTIPENSTKQIELFDPAKGVPTDKVMVYYGLQGWPSFFPNPVTDRDLGYQTNKKVDIYLRFRNGKENGMGMPLPSGRIRVSKLDPEDQSLEFIGEDVIDHTPKDEQVLIKMGSAFDVVGERSIQDFQVSYDEHWMDETIEIKLRNHKAEAVNVIVKENLYRWVNWEIKEKTHQFEKIDARTVHFPVRVEPDKEVVVRYKVRYTW
jgi:hypothetical protein